MKTTHDWHKVFADACVLMAASGLLACATVNQHPPPADQQFAAAQRSVDIARESGAQNYAEGAKYLNLAETQLAQAKSALAAGHNRSAALLLARAEADADLGMVLAHKLHSQAESRQLEQQIAQSTPSTK